jgi:hypothetical protein
VLPVLNPIAFNVVVATGSWMVALGVLLALGGEISVPAVTLGVRRAAWAVWSLAACVFFLQGASFAGDSLLQHSDVLGNAAACAIPFIGIIFAAIGVSRRSQV